jgi:antitoxin MazE
MQTVCKWGNSLAVRIPAAFAETVGLCEGTEVDLNIQAGRLIVAPVRQQRYDLQQLLEQITPENRHDLVDWGKPVGKEVW